jgi:uncharacterized transporter YbjL
MPALVRQLTGGQTSFPTQLWLLPDHNPVPPAVVGLPLFLVAAVGFAAAAGSLSRFAFRGANWRSFAVTAAVASATAVALLFGTWPGAPDGFYAVVNAAVALVVDFAVLGALLVLHWPPERAMT